MRRILLTSRVALSFSAATLVLSVTLAASGAPAPPRVVAIDAGGGNTCVLMSSGAVRCWGYNAQGQLGNGRARGTLHSSNVPVAVSGLTGGVRTISVGGAHTCAITRARGMRCWGLNGWGELGNGVESTLHDVPVGVSGLASGVAAIAAGGTHSCALTAAGGVKCWGSNGSGQLASTTIQIRRTPLDMPGLATGIRAIVAGGNNASTNGGQSCVLMSVGGVKCWGVYPGNGGPGCCSATPVDVAGLTNGVTAIAASGRHTCAITSVGGLKCWGENSWGELGDGTGTHRLTPVDVVGLSSGVKAVTLGQSLTCVLTTAGGVKCWGFNRHGEVGTGSRADQGPRTPTDVVGLRSGVAAISAGQAHVCALMVRGGVKCWGDNSVGQLGTGTRIHDSARPVDVRLGTPRSTPRTPATARLLPFVDRLEAVLVQSAAGRRELAAAISAGFRCSISTRAAATRIARVVDNRNRLLRQLAGVRGPTRQAVQAVSLLRLGLQHSIEADRHYRDGFLSIPAAGCPLPQNANFAAARRSDARATAAKRRFVRAFNPLARQVNRRTWSANEI
jgi:alpha-tubulin suppressor-like RCC1 family protein